jgi:ppGpp synthetase/RelA/SpoT-type nucleotidyltranferase
VHYVIKPRKKTRYTCEIQVRTLMEEVWGEVNHSLNYPHETKSLACREQIAALARTTSASTRLVDAIFRSHADFKKTQLRKPA